MFFLGLPPLSNVLFPHQRAPPLHLSGMRSAQSLAEWQLQAVLFRARLTQYFEVFISQGGDDIDQIMQCDETEFLEIMSLVNSNEFASIVSIQGWHGLQASARAPSSAHPERVFTEQSPILGQHRAIHWCLLWRDLHKKMVC